MQKWIIGNWKMHKTVAETIEHISALKPLVFRAHSPVWLAVPFTDIYAAAQAALGSHIEIGAQNMSDLLGGALTGEISGVMIKEAGASFVILGHSERRRHFQEDNHNVNRKVKLALRLGLTPIVCIGETAEEKAAGATEQVLSRQLQECLDGVVVDSTITPIIAYEPVWAIGSKQAAPVEIVEKIHHFCHNWIAQLNWQGVSRVVYGGAVSPDNCGDFLKADGVDGLLIGGASLDVRAFTDIVWKAEGIRT